MINNNLLALAIVIAFSVTTSSCSKFEDGPAISFRKISNRMAGEYKIDYISKNESDLSSFWHQYYDIQFSINKLHAGSSDFMSYSANGNIICEDTIKRYQFVDYFEVFINKTVTVKMRNYFRDSLQYPGRLFYPIFILPNQEKPLYSVSRLTKEEMWLEHTNETDHYEIHFKKIVYD